MIRVVILLSCVSVSLLWSCFNFYPTQLGIMYFFPLRWGVGGVVLEILQIKTTSFLDGPKDDVSILINQVCRHFFCRWSTIVVDHEQPRTYSLFLVFNISWYWFFTWLPTIPCTSSYYILPWVYSPNINKFCSVHSPWLLHASIDWWRWYSKSRVLDLTFSLL